MSTHVADNQVLTARQQMVLDFFFSVLLECGTQPSLKDICDHIGFENPTGAKNHMNALVRKGWLAFPEKKGISRGMKILRQPDGSPFAGLRFVTTPTLENPVP